MLYWVYIRKIFYIILSLYMEDHKKKVWISCLWLVFRPPQSGCFFGSFTAEKALKSFSGTNNSLAPPVIGFSNRLPYGLEESRESRIFLAIRLLGVEKYWKFPQAIFFSHHYGFISCFEILHSHFSNINPEGISTCKI